MFLLLNTSQTFTVFRLKQITLILFEPEATMILLPVLPVLPHAPSPPSPPIMLLLASLFSLTTLKHLFLKRGGAQLKIERENKAAAPQRGEDDGRWGRTMDDGGGRWTMGEDDGRWGKGARWGRTSDVGPCCQHHVGAAQEMKHSGTKSTGESDEVYFLWQEENRGERTGPVLVLVLVLFLF